MYIMHSFVYFMSILWSAAVKVKKYKLQFLDHPILYDGTVCCVYFVSFMLWGPPLTKSTLAKDGHLNLLDSH